MNEFLNNDTMQTMAWYGFLFGGLLVGLVALIGHRSYKRTLLYCAEGKTAEKLIDGRFYYLVEESEYNRLKLQDLQIPQEVLNEQEISRTLERNLQEERKAKSQVYTERNRLVALLTKLYPSGVDPANASSLWPVVYVELPTGQVSWHVPRHELKELFPDLPFYTKEWDGHTTEEKYRRLEAWGKLVRPIKLDAAEQPKLELNLLERQAIETLNNIKAWDGAEAFNRLPMELQMQVDVVLGFAAMRRNGVSA